MLIQLYPSKVLLQKSSDVEVFDQSLKDTVVQMANLMRKLRGIGLAAPQVGLNKNLFIMDLNPTVKEENSLEDIEVVINPKIISFSKDSVSDLEGCLSFPSIFEKIPRYSNITVEYRDLNNNLITKIFDQREARCFQHEFEHLQGEVFLKHISALKRDMAKRKMAKINSLLGRV